MSEQRQDSHDEPLFQLADFYLSIGLVVAGWVFAVWLYPQLPEQVPVHWGVSGEPDRYGSALEGAFFAPGMMTFLLVVLATLPLIDPRREHYEQFKDVYLTILNATLVFLIGLQLALGMLYLGYKVDVVKIVILGTGALFVVLGNLLPKLKSNWFAGIRTPWTLDDDRVWLRTNRLGGRAFIALGLAIMVSAWLPEVWAFVITIGGSMLLVVGLVLYSYLEFRRLNRGRS